MKWDQVGQVGHGISTALVNNIKKNIIQDFLSNSSNCTSSETSSYNSECNDEEEIALAIQAAELASRNEARSRFRSSSDLIHRLFVCIAGKFLIIFVLNKILHFKMMANLMTLLLHLSQCIKFC